VSECDVNSFNSPSNGCSLSIGQLYIQNGFMCTPSGDPHRKTSGTIDILNDMFALDKSRTHINERLKRGIPEASQRSGAPIIYMYNDCINCKAELEGWIENPKTGMPMDGDDHLISGMLFLASRPRRYMGDFLLVAHDDIPTSRLKVDKYSKY